MAYNLRHHGVFSLDTDRAPDALRPSRYREPLPILVLAGYMAALDPFFRDATLDTLLKGKKPDRFKYSNVFLDALLAWDDVSLNTLFKGEKANLLRYSNLLWAALLVWAMILTTRRLRIPAWAAALAILLAHFSLQDSYHRFHTELPAAALITLASYLALLSLQERHLLHFFYAGLSFGLLILTKTSFLYISIALLVIYSVYARINAKDSGQRRFAFSSTVLTIAGIALVIGPWMLRNQMLFGSPKLADRGGAVLMERAIKNGMTSAEYAGTLYAYAPLVLKKPIAALMGYRPEDLLAGGQFQRLQRFSNRRSDRKAINEGRINDVVSYHNRAVGIMESKQTAFNAAGHPNPFGAADAELQNEATAMIKTNLLDHFAMILPFMWRGAPFMGPFLLAALIYAWRRRDAPLAAYILPSLGMICFYALFSHFIPRYAEPNAPIVAICFILLLHRWLEGRKLKHVAQ